MLSTPPKLHATRGRAILSVKVSPNRPNMFSEPTGSDKPECRPCVLGVVMVRFKASTNVYSQLCKYLGALRNREIYLDDLLVLFPVPRSSDRCKYLVKGACNV